MSFFTQQLHYIPLHHFTIIIIVGTVVRPTKLERNDILNTKNNEFDSVAIFPLWHQSPMFAHFQGGSALCSPVPMFPGTDVPRTYVPRYRCSPVPSYVPRYLCSPKPMFPGRPTYIYVPRYLCSPNLCSPVPMFPDLLQIC